MSQTFDITHDDVDFMPILIADNGIALGQDNKLMNAHNDLENVKALFEIDNIPNNMKFIHKNEKHDVVKNSLNKALDFAKGHYSSQNKHLIIFLYYSGHGKLLTYKNKV